MIIWFMIYHNMQNKNNFSQKLLEIIKEKKVSPKPRWQFMLKDYAVWSLGVLCLLTGALVVSVAIYMVRGSDWGIYRQITGSLWEFILLTLPYFWLFLFALFLFAVYYNIKHTKKGYRYSLVATVGVAAMALLVFGGLFYQIGLGSRLDRALAGNAPFYDSVINRRIHFWSQPEQGRLSGLIIEVEDKQAIVLADRGRRQWLVRISNAEFMPGAEIKIGNSVRTLGEKIMENEFRANLVLPLKQGKEFFHRMSHENCPGPMSGGNCITCPKTVR